MNPPTAKPSDVPAERLSDFQRGMELIGALDEVMPDQAEGLIAELYDDLRARLRVPFVNLLFRVLANYPQPFREAWTAVAPRVGTVGFERAADHLRAAAVADPPPVPSDRGWTEAEGLSQVRAFTASIHYVLPKLLLVATAFDRLLDGGRGDDGAPAGGVPWLGVERDEVLPAGPAPGTIQLELVDPAAAEGRVAEVFQEIRERHGHPGVASYYRALGHWPDLLSGLWREVEPEVGSAARARRKGHVVELAGTLGSAIRGSSGECLAVADTPLEEVRAILSVFRYRLVPDLLLDVARIRALIDGQGAAFASPFSFHSL